MQQRRELHEDYQQHENFYLPLPISDLIHLNLGVDPEIRQVLREKCHIRVIIKTFHSFLVTVNYSNSSLLKDTAPITDADPKIEILLVYDSCRVRKADHFHSLGQSHQT